MKAAIVTLGCDKNTVDSERYAASLTDTGCEVVSDAAEADVIVVNTCGFIDAAKKESIDALVEAGRSRAAGRCRAVVALGCMVERHKAELEEALPEVDLFLGSSEVDRLIPELVARGLIDPDGAPSPHPGVRRFTGGTPHVRYLKVSEGCDHGCAFCAIPLMRGRHRSFALEDVVAEAQLLEAQGAREIALVAQDLAHWGRDRRADGRSLPDLLQALLAETTVPWFRLLYVYSAGLTTRVLELMAREPRLVPYVDMPIQHASDAVLARMRRPERERTIRATVKRIRETVPDVAIRSTCIVGFPGETDDDFAGLLGFLEEIAFDRLGAFTYSAQQGTRAAELDDDVPDLLKRERLERLEEVQRLVTAERYEGRVGRVVRAMVDRRTDAGVEGRTIWQADEIDGITMLAAGGGVESRPGTIVDAAVVSVVDDVNFDARVVGVASPAPAPAATASPTRSLRVLSTVGSFGR